MTNNQLTSTHLAVKSELDGYKIHASRGQATAMAMVRLFESIDRDLEELHERRKAESEPVFTLEVSQADYKGQKLGNHFGFITLDAARELKEGNYQLYTAQPAPVVPETAHSSVIAEQLAHVLSGLKVTDHQRAVISCAVDRLNNVAQLLQLSPSALLVPEILDYQGAKELYNYLMTEEEINATVNGWNSCRAAMLQTKSLTSINPAPDLVSLQKKAESIIGNYPGIPDCWCRTCRPVVLNDMRFVVCPDCGNKRCPRANDHRNACTGSNEPGQEGSAYPDTLHESKP